MWLQACRRVRRPQCCRLRLPGPTVEMANVLQVDTACCGTLACHGRYAVYAMRRVVKRVRTDRSLSSVRCQRGNSLVTDRQHARQARTSSYVIGRYVQFWYDRRFLPSFCECRHGHARQIPKAVSSGIKGVCSQQSITAVPLCLCRNGLTEAVGVAQPGQWCRMTVAGPCVQPANQTKAQNEMQCALMDVLCQHEMAIWGSV